MLEGADSISPEPVSGRSETKSGTKARLTSPLDAAVRNVLIKATSS